MSIELSRRYLEVCLENKEDQIRDLLNDQSCEKHFDLGYDHIGQDEIYLSNDVFFECCEWLDVQVLNQYESKNIDNAHSYALLEMKVSGKIKDEKLPFKNLGCQLYKWSYDRKLIFLKFFGEVPWDQNNEDKIKQAKVSCNTEENVDLNGKNSYLSVVDNQVFKEFDWFTSETDISVLLHQKEAINNVKIDEFKKRYQKLNTLSKNLSIKTSFVSENTSIIESQITGIEEPSLPFDIRECFISEWANNKMIKCRLYSVMVPCLENVMERINKI